MGKNNPKAARKEKNSVQAENAVVESGGKKKKAVLGCFRRRETWLPTWRGCLLIVLLVFVGGIFLLLGIHPFLAPNHPIAGGILVVEGWAPDYAMKTVAQEFSGGTPGKVYVTGGPIEHGAPLSEFKTYAELGAATLSKCGLGTNAVQAVPAPLVQQDRTFNSALALRKYLDENGIAHPAITLISVGPHARRSRLLYEKAFGKQTRIGIIALAPREYDPKRWWRSSQGVRAVLSEIFAYCYVRLLFRPKSEAIVPQ